MANTNYGSTLTKGGQSIGKCIVTEFPEIKTEKVESTNHSSGGKREYIPNGLIGLEDITVSVIVASGIMAAMYADMEAKTVSEFEISNSEDTMTFSGFYTSIKPEAADSQNPDLDKLTVVISPTGDLSL